MRTWLAPIVLALVLLWVWWMRRQLRAAYLGRLVAAAHGRASRARTVTLGWQLGVALVGAVCIALAVVAQLVWDAPVARIGLLLFVIAVVVPLGSIAAGRDERSGKPRVQVRRSVQQRLAELGASPEVADVVVRVSKPFAYVSFAYALLAALLLAWRP